MTGLELGPAIVLAALLWSAGQVAVALIKGHASARRTHRVDELLHHVDHVAVVGRDLLATLELVGEDVTALRNVAEQRRSP